MESGTNEKFGQKRGFQVNAVNQLSENGVMKNRVVCTFHKCGSNWVRDIFMLVAQDANMTYSPFPISDSRFGGVIARGAGEVSLFSIGRIEHVIDRLSSNFLDESRVVLAVRDPRDALVSQYFSWRNTHKNNSKELLNARDKLVELSPKDGIAWILESRKFAFGNAILPWRTKIKISENISLMKYENLLENFPLELQSSLRFLEIECTKMDLDSILKKTGFESKTKRKPGEEDLTSHYRKGVAGDYVNYFDMELSELLIRQYGNIVQDLGYE